jgi:hypothetical protein
MISDIISQVVVDLDYYLTDPDFDHAYIGEAREWIIQLRDEADHLRRLLDMPPATASASHDRPTRRLPR